MACNWVLVPKAMELAAGMTCRVLALVLLTVTLVVAVTPSRFAERVTVPAATPVI
ncbi:hypothetical protein D3C80_1918930 [compost metagenome]